MFHSHSVLVFWGWAQADRWGRGLWDACCAAVSCEAGEDRCGRPAAAAAGDGGDADWVDDYVGDDDVAAVVVG